MPKFVQSVLMILRSPEEDRIETSGNKPSALTSDSASGFLNDATSHQVEDEMETKNSTAEDECLGEGEEPFLYDLHFLSSQQLLLVPSKLGSWFRVFCCSV